jgi:flagellar biosynthesis protein FlhG
VLGLHPDADPSEVRRSYLERKALYSAESTATYTLLEDDEREALLERIEEAYQRIVGTRAQRPPTTAIPEELPEPPTGEAPAADEQPGAHLQHHRLSRSLPLSEVAEEIKVRAALLERLEEERFSDLPASVYVRGFVVQYARLLGLPDPDAIAAAYIAKMEEARSES